MEDNKFSWGCLIPIALIIVFLLWSVTSCVKSAGFQRELKDWRSEHNGGIERVVTAYSYTGEELGQWEGKFDISEQSDEIKFDMENGKRVIIRGGIVISEEVTDEGRND